MKFVPLLPTASVFQYRRNLPHWRAPGATYFVTFRTADSLPRNRLGQLEQQRRLWILVNPPPWTPLQYAEYYRYRFQELDQWLDQGAGTCALREPDLANMLESTLRFHDGQRFVLDRFAVMPNHVHALLLPFASWKLEGILQNWKSRSGHLANRFLQRHGRFWLDENYDRIVRSVDELERIRAYIMENPARANLAPGSYILGCGTGIET